MKLKHYFLTGLCIAMMSSSALAGTYTCYNYVGGKPTGGHVKVEADSEYEAAQKAAHEYEKMGKRSDYVKCEYN